MSCSPDINYLGSIPTALIGRLPTRPAPTAGGTASVLLPSRRSRGRSRGSAELLPPPSPALLPPAPAPAPGKAATAPALPRRRLLLLREGPSAALTSRSGPPRPRIPVSGSVVPVPAPRSPPPRSNPTARPAPVTTHLAPYRMAGPGSVQHGAPLCRTTWRPPLMASLLPFRCLPRPARPQPR